jgi:radical SAM PhpK family P-methyltransferase
MTQQIDCLLIGHNDIGLEEHEKTCREMGRQSGVFRDLNLSYLRYNRKPYSAAGFFNLLNRDHDGKPYVPPLTSGGTFNAAIAYLGSYLHRQGHTFDFVNSFQEEKEALAEKLENKNVLTVAIITTLYISVLPILEIVDFVRTHNPGARIIVGGPFITTQVRTLDDKAFQYLAGETIDADYFVNSAQGEATLVRIIQALKNNRPVAAIPNIYYKSPQRWEATPLEPEDNPLEQNPVQWELFSGRIGEFVNIRTAISCPFSCAFCGFPQHAGRYQTTSVEYIENQLNQLQRASRIKNVYFIDDTFNVPPNRFKDILRMLIKNNYSFKWHSYLRCQFIDRETVELMKQSGCEGVFLGIESGSEQILKNMNKAAALDKYKEGIGLLKEAGITTFGSFIIGFPGETEDTVKETISFIQQGGLDFYRAQLWYGEPITPIWKQKEAFDIKGESFEWSHSTMDSRTACDWIDELFLTAENSTWIPQYNFDFDAIWHLIHRGITMDQVKELLAGFNLGIREKLHHPQRAEAGYEAIRRMQSIFLPGDTPPLNAADEEDIMQSFDVGFDF